MPRFAHHKLVAVAAFAVLALILLVPAAASAVAWIQAGESTESAASAVQDESGLRVALDADADVVIAGKSLDVPDVAVEETLPVDARDAPVAPGSHETRHEVDTDRYLDTTVARARLGAGLGVDDGRPSQAAAGASTTTAGDSGVDVAAAPMWVAAAAVGAAGALAWFWPQVKRFGLLAFVPLYARVTRQEVFQNGVRERIYQFVDADPGISASDLAKRAGVSWGTTMYHLEVLEQNQVVVSEKSGRYRRYFANGAVLPKARKGLAVLKNARTAEVVRAVESEPGLTQKEISRATGMSPQALHWHMSRLHDAGLVRKVREGRVVRHFPGAETA